MGRKGIAARSEPTCGAPPVGERPGKARAHGERRPRAKLHRWAAGEPGRWFVDLFNLVYDPAFLAAAWDRVAAHKGARTAGIDRATAARIEAPAGVGAFLGQIRDSLKAGEFRPVFRAIRVSQPRPVPWCPHITLNSRPAAANTEPSRINP
jgi:hypothetical protein